MSKWNDVSKEETRCYIFSQNEDGTEVSYLIHSPSKQKQSENGNELVYDDEGVKHEVRNHWLAIRTTPKNNNVSVKKEQ